MVQLSLNLLKLVQLLHLKEHQSVDLLLEQYLLTGQGVHVDLGHLCHLLEWVHRYQGHRLANCGEPRSLHHHLFGFKRFFLIKFWLLVVETVVHGILIWPHNLAVPQKVIEMHIRRRDFWMGRQNLRHQRFLYLMVLSFLCFLLFCHFEKRNFRAAIYELKNITFLKSTFCVTLPL